MGEKNNAKMYKRLTADLPIGNFNTMMNYAYAKDERVVLRYGNGTTDIDLCEYIAETAAEKYCEHTANEIMDGACIECDCPFAILFTVATQAAELRERLKMHENEAEEREKGCEHCKTVIYECHTNTPYVYKRINNKFCPMCGRRLEG